MLKIYIQCCMTAHLVATSSSCPSSHHSKKRCCNGLTAWLSVANSTTCAHDFTAPLFRRPASVSLGTCGLQLTLLCVSPPLCLSHTDTSASTSVTELMAALAPMGVTREQLVTALRGIADVVTLDERTGVVRPRKAGAAPAPAATEVEAA